MNIDDIRIHQTMDKPKKDNQTYYQLEHQGVCLAVADDGKVLSALKQVISKLINDKRIQDIVEKHPKVYGSQEFKMYDIRLLSGLWDAGNLELPEENYPVCDGCLLSLATQLQLLLLDQNREL